VSHWFSVNVLPYLLHGAAGTLGAAFAAGVIITPFRHVFARLHRAVNSLDPETDYGVTRQLSQINKELQKPQSIKVHR